MIQRVKDPIDHILDDPKFLADLYDAEPVNTPKSIGHRAASSGLIWLLFSFGIGMMILAVGIGIGVNL